MSISLSLVAALAITAAPQSDWTEPLEPFEIADDLYYVGSAGLAAYLFTSEEGHILLDVPLDENVPMILDNVRRLGFDPADIEVLIASHAHFDHVGGLARMREITGAQVVLSAGDAQLIAAGGVGPAGAGAFPAVRADRLIGHRETVSRGRWTLTAQVTPGHTPGCTSWSGTASIGGAPLTFVSVCSLSVLGFLPGRTRRDVPGHGRSVLQERRDAAWARARPLPGTARQLHRPGGEAARAPERKCPGRSSIQRAIARGSTEPPRPSNRRWRSKAIRVVVPSSSVEVNRSQRKSSVDPRPCVPVAYRA